MTTTLSTRTATWENIGTDVKECKNNLDEILRKANLDYTVITQPVTVGNSDTPSDKWKAIVRESDGHVYNIAKQSYTVCQNREAFDFINELGNVTIEKAGESQSGMIYIIGKLDSINVLGDEFTPYAIFQNSHNSDFALKTAIVPLRMVCQNQFSAAFGDANNTVTIKHTPGITSSLQDAKIIQQSSLDYMKEFARKAEFFATNKVNVNKAIELLIPIKDDASERTANRLEEARSLLRTAYMADDNGNFRGTAWGILNAVTDYTTHSISPRSKGESRFTSSILYPDFQKKAIGLIYSGAIAA